MSDPIQNKMTSRCVLVLGMHRSGTSAVTRCLNLVGMDVGSHLLTPDSVNAKGYWEHADAVRINDALLAAFGMAWWSLDPLPEGWLTSDAALKARTEIEQLVARDFLGVPLWGIKDPRMCRLAPLWIDVLHGLGIAVSAVFTVRSALEVARSLVRAQGLSEGAGVLSWALHLAESEHATRGMARVLIHYDQLLTDPVATMERMGQALGLSWPIDPRRRVEALGAFIDTGLRTQRSLAGAERLPPVVRRLEAAGDRVAAEGTPASWSALAERSDEAIEFLQLIHYRQCAPLPNEVVHDGRPADDDVAYASLYHAVDGEDFSEDRVVHKAVRPGRSRIELPVPAGEGIRYRLDPSSHPGYYVMHSLVLVDGARELLWDWREAPEQAPMAGITVMDSPSHPGTPLHLMDKDPQIFLQWPEGRVREGATLVLDIERFASGRMEHEFTALDQRCQRMDVQIGNLRDRVGELEDEIGALNAERRAREGALAAIGQRLESVAATAARQDVALQLLLKRDLLSRLRRRFATARVRLVPGQDLELVDAAASRFRVTGGDPMFNCSSPDYPLAPGWYMVTLRMEQHAGTPVEARLYADYGPHVGPDLVGVNLRFVEPGKVVHRGLVRFPHTVFGLRFDPATAACELSVQGLGLRRISKAHAAWELLRNVRARPGAGRSGPGWRRTLARLKAEGVPSTVDWLYARYGEAGLYDTWLAAYDPPASRDVARARAESDHWRYRPLVSILMPTYNSEEEWLRRCIESVQAQAYPNWELCIADDASPEPRVMRVLNEYAARDTRVRVTRREKNGHISASSNTALAMARGEYVALLDHDDELHPFALHEVVAALQKHPQWKLIFTDEDKIDENGRRYDPYMKPDWNYDLLLSQNCISHLGVYQRELLDAIGGFRQGFEGSQDWDLALRCIERLAPAEIGHVAKVLYHWRAIPGSTSTGVDQKGYARQAALKALGEHLARIGSDALVEEIADRPGNFRVRYNLPARPPKISLIIPTRDGLKLLRQCVDSILARSTYGNYEIVIVDNQSREPETLAYFGEVVADPRVRVLSYDQPFNYSAINNYAVAQTDGAIVGLVNNDIEVITPEWMEELAGHAMRPEIGAVGAMLYYPNGTIQHAGVVLGVHGVAAHAYCGEPRGYPGQMGRARLTQSLSAVTAACLLVRRSVFDEVGGFDETLGVAFNDVDLCLRIRRAGYRNLWTPFAELYHHESATRGREDSPEKIKRFAGEVEHMIATWGAALLCDPAYNPNLTVSGVPYTLAFPPRHDADAGIGEADPGKNVPEKLVLGD